LTTERATLTNSHLDDKQFDNKKCHTIWQHTEAPWQKKVPITLTTYRVTLTTKNVTHWQHTESLWQKKVPLTVTLTTTESAIYTDNIQSHLDNNKVDSKKCHSLNSINSHLDNKLDNKKCHWLWQLQSHRYIYSYNMKSLIKWQHPDLHTLTIFWSSYSDIKQIQILLQHTDNIQFYMLWQHAQPQTLTACVASHLDNMQIHILRWHIKLLILTTYWVSYKDNM